MKSCNSIGIAVAAIMLATTISRDARGSGNEAAYVWFANVLPAASRSFINEYPVFDRMRHIVDRASKQHQVFLGEVDLDGDGVSERLVMIQDAEVCGSAGCSLLVFKAILGQWRVVSTISGHRGVLAVERKSDQGWQRLHNGRHQQYRWHNCGYHLKEVLEEYEKLGTEPCATD
jgi:hypothetical protein